MTPAVFCLATALFCLGFYLTGVVPNCRRILRDMQEATAVISHKTMTDLEKEKAVQRASLDLLGQSFVLTARIAVVLLLTFAPFYLADRLGWVALDKSLAFAARIDVLVTTSVVVALLVFVLGKARAAYAKRQ